MRNRSADIAYFLLAAAACSGPFSLVGSAFAQAWTQTTAPITNWSSVASSADGSKLVAVAGGFPGTGGIYVSTNSGADWMATGAPAMGWNSVACSADGSKLLAAALGGPLYTSTNSGASWTSNSIGSGFWWSVASSADGNKLFAAQSACGLAMFGGVSLSTNSGETWTVAEGSQVCPTFVACSADGNMLWIISSDYSIFSSRDAGSNLTRVTLASKPWTSLTTSSDGSKLVAVAGERNYVGPIYRSTDSGATWIGTDAPTTNWVSVASSADGSKVVAAAGAGGIGIAIPSSPIYRSTDFGATWADTGAPAKNWSSVASSADGSKFFAVVYGGGIYTAQSTPTPALSSWFSGEGLILSWTVPSQDFVLQQSSDLSTTNWADVSNTPTLNLSNLQYQVTLPLASGRRFYRLKH